VETHALHGEQLNANLVRVVQFVICIWAFVHVVAGMFVWLGHYELWTYIAESGDLADLSRLQQVSWITANAFGRMQLLPSEIYLRGYFWSAYTVITVGYGSIQLATNKERLMAVCAMSIGAIACNAGIAAVLGSIIGTADRLSGTCRRQLESVLRFCISNKIGATPQQQLQQHHAYRSLHLDNSIDDDDEFSVLGVAIRHEYIYSCVQSALDRVIFLSPETFPPLKKSTSALGSGNIGQGKDAECLHGSGFVHSLVRLLTPFVAIPEQVLLCDAKLPVAGTSARDCADGWCDDLLVLRAGACHYCVHTKGEAEVMVIPIQPGEVILPQASTQLLESIHCEGCCGHYLVKEELEEASEVDKMSSETETPRSDADSEETVAVRLMCIAVLTVTLPKTASPYFQIEANCSDRTAVTSIHNGQEKNAYTNSSEESSMHAIASEPSIAGSASASANEVGNASQTAIPVNEIMLMTVPFDANDLQLGVWSRPRDADPRCLGTCNINLEALTFSVSADLGQSLSGQSAYRAQQQLEKDRMYDAHTNTHAQLPIAAVSVTHTLSQEAAAVIRETSGHAAPAPSSPQEARRTTRHNKKAGRSSMRPNAQSKGTSNRPGVVSIATLLQTPSSEDRVGPYEESEDEGEEEEKEGGSEISKSTSSNSMKEEETKSTNSDSASGQDGSGGETDAEAEQQLQRAITLSLDDSAGNACGAITILVTMLARRQSQSCNDTAEKSGTKTPNGHNGPHRTQPKTPYNNRPLTGKSRKAEADPVAQCPLGEGCRRLQSRYTVVADSFCHFFRASKSDVVSLIGQYENSRKPIEQRYEGIRIPTAAALSRCDFGSKAGACMQPLSLSVQSLNMSNLPSEKPMLAAAIGGIAAAHAALRGGGTAASLNGHSSSILGGYSGAGTPVSPHSDSPRDSSRGGAGEAMTIVSNAVALGDATPTAVENARHPTVHLEDLEYP